MAVCIVIPTFIRSSSIKICVKCLAVCKVHRKSFQTYPNATVECTLLAIVWQEKTNNGRFLRMRVILCRRCSNAFVKIRCSCRIPRNLSLLFQQKALFHAEAITLITVSVYILHECSASNFYLVKNCMSEIKGVRFRFIVETTWNTHKNSVHISKMNTLPNKKLRHLSQKRRESVDQKCFSCLQQQPNKWFDGIFHAIKVVTFFVCSYCSWGFFPFRVLISLKFKNQKLKREWWQIKG